MPKIAIWRWESACLQRYEAKKSRKSCIFNGNWNKDWRFSRIFCFVYVGCVWVENMSHVRRHTLTECICIVDAWKIIIVYFIFVHKNTSHIRQYTLNDCIGFLLYDYYFRKCEGCSSTYTTAVRSRSGTWFFERGHLTNSQVGDPEKKNRTPKQASNKNNNNTQTIMKRFHPT